MFQITYATKSGKKMVRDALTLAAARSEARKIAKRGFAVKVWSPSGFLSASY